MLLELRARVIPAPEPEKPEKPETDPKDRDPSKSKEKYTSKNNADAGAGAGAGGAAAEGGVTAEGEGREGRGPGAGAGAGAAAAVGAKADPEVEKGSTSQVQEQEAMQGKGEGTVAAAAADDALPQDPDGGAREVQEPGIAEDEGIDWRRIDDYLDDMDYEPPSDEDMMEEEAFAAYVMGVGGRPEPRPDAPRPATLPNTRASEFKKALGQRLRQPPPGSLLDVAELKKGLEYVHGHVELEWLPFSFPWHGYMFA